MFDPMTHTVPTKVPSFTETDMQSFELNMLDFVHLRAEFRTIRALYTQDKEIMKMHSSTSRDGNCKDRRASYET